MAGKYSVLISIGILNTLIFYACVSIPDKTAGGKSSPDVTRNDYYYLEPTPDIIPPLFGGLQAEFNPIDLGYFTGVGLWSIRSNLLNHNHRRIYDYLLSHADKSAGQTKTKVLAMIREYEAEYLQARPVC